MYYEVNFIVQRRGDKKATRCTYYNKYVDTNCTYPKYKKDIQEQLGSFGQSIVKMNETYYPLSIFQDLKTDDLDILKSKRKKVNADVGQSSQQASIRVEGYLYHLDEKQCLDDLNLVFSKLKNILDNAKPIIKTVVKEYVVDFAFEKELENI